MSRYKNCVVVMDMGINSLSLVDELKKAYPSENIVYINDLEVNDYESIIIDDAKERVGNLINRCREYNPKLLIIANDSLVEYGKEYIDAYSKDKVNIVDVIIDSVLEKYEFKNIGFLAPQGIIQSNMYQRNFNYARLYNLNADNMKDSLEGVLIKTPLSFKEVKSTFLPAYNKDIDVLVPTIPNVLLYKTEIREYSNDMNILDINKEMCKAIKDKVSQSKVKFGKVTLVVRKYDNKIENKNMREKYSKILSCKYKLKEISIAKEVK